MEIFTMNLSEGIQNFNASKINLGTKYDAAKILGVSPETLKRYRRQEEKGLVQGIHYFVLNQRVIRYNLDLIVDWAIHRDNPSAHQIAIDAYLQSLPANQPKKRGRKAKP
jgi:hypothetical protein